MQIFYDCCCKKICKKCSGKCLQYDNRCPLCREPAPKSEAELLSRLQKHVDKGIAEAQIALGDAYSEGILGLKKSPKRATQLYQLAAAQEHAIAQAQLGGCYEHGKGVKINHKTAAQWFRRAAEQGYPLAQYDLGYTYANGKGVAQSYKEAVKWYRLAAAQGHAGALFNLGECHVKGEGVPRDIYEALRLLTRAAAQGCADAAERVDELTPTGGA